MPKSTLPSAFTDGALTLPIASSASMVYCRSVGLKSGLSIMAALSPPLPELQAVASKAVVSITIDWILCDMLFND